MYDNPFEFNAYYFFSFSRSENKFIDFPPSHYFVASKNSITPSKRRFPILTVNSHLSLRWNVQQKLDCKQNFRFLITHKKKALTSVIGAN